MQMTRIQTSSLIVLLALALALSAFPGPARAAPVAKVETGRVANSDYAQRIVEYASLSCPYSRRFQLETFPLLKKEYIDTGKVRLILREFPIGKQSGLATIALRCAPPDTYFALYDKFMSQQASWVSQEVRPDPIYLVAAQVGLTRSQFDSCREDQRLVARVNWVKEHGRKLGVIGTPNFFIQGCELPGCRHFRRLLGLSLGGSRDDGPLAIAICVLPWGWAAPARVPLHCI